MKTAIRVLIVEDSEDDALLVLRELNRQFDVCHERVDTAEAMARALETRNWDIVISDFLMPRFDALKSLELMQKKGVDIPFIIVSGKIGEIVAVEAMKAGAHDYVMKDDLTRLVPAIKRELREALIREERLVAEEKLRKHLSAMEASTDGIAIINADEEFDYMNYAHARLYGYDYPGELIGRSWRCLYGDTERERIEQTVMPYCREKGSWRGEAVGLKKDGSTFNQELSLTVIEDSGIVCIVHDITERKRVEKILKEQLHFIQSLIDAIPTPVFYKNKEGIFLGCNAAFERHSNFRKDEIIGKSVFDIMPQNLAEKFTEADLELLQRSGTQIYESSMAFTNGISHDVILYKATFSTTDNDVGGLVGTILDITERKQAEERLRYISTHDDLTGLYNRGYFQEEMERLERSRKFPISVVMADVDGLKTVNDQLGHAVGDELLKRAANVLKSAFRAEDVVARIGGDEFAVLLPSSDANSVEEALQRVFTHIDQNNDSFGPIKLSLSIGAATATKGDHLVEIQKIADLRMYQHKTSRA